MPIKINFNICDNSPECSGIAVCPTGAIYWDSNAINVLGEKGALCVDNNKCISCGNCVGDEGCPVGAIIFSKSKYGLDKMTTQIKVDINKVKSLFVERYGAEPIDDDICIIKSELNNYISEGVTVIEEFTEQSIQCLLTSIPIENIIQIINENITCNDIHFYKCDCTGEDCEAFPKLKIYDNGKLICQVNGYYNTSEIDEVKKFLNNNK